MASLFEGTRFSCRARRATSPTRSSTRTSATPRAAWTARRATRAVAEDEGQPGGARRKAAHEHGGAPRAATRRAPARKESECSSCHAEIRLDQPPPSHRANWTRYHGTLVRGRSSDRADQCALCHQPSECTTCHQIEPPEKPQQLLAPARPRASPRAWTGESCMTCHDSDSCQRCHEDQQPAQPRRRLGRAAGPALPRLPRAAARESCGVCHAATPSHEQATPLPPDHAPGMDCRACATATASRCRTSTTGRPARPATAEAEICAAREAGEDCRVRRPRHRSSPKDQPVMRFLARGSQRAARVESGRTSPSTIAHLFVRR